MLTFDLYNILIIAGIIFVALVTFGLIIARLYRRSSKEISFVRTGWGGESDFRWRRNRAPCLA